MTERLSDTYRFTGTLLVHDSGNTERPRSTEVSAFVKIEDGCIAVTPAQHVDGVPDMERELPEFPWIQLDTTGMSASDYVEALVAALVEVPRLHKEANMVSAPRT